MDGVYFQQGIDAAQGAATVDDCAKLRPYPADSPKGRPWTNGFWWEIYRIRAAYKEHVESLVCKPSNL